MSYQKHFILKTGCETQSWASLKNDTTLKKRKLRSGESSSFKTRSSLLKVWQTLLKLKISLRKTLGSSNRENLEIVEMEFKLLQLFQKSKISSEVAQVQEHTLLKSTLKILFFIEIGNSIFEFSHCSLRSMEN